MWIYMDSSVGLRSFANDRRIPVRVVFVSVKIPLQPIVETVLRTW